MTNPYVLGGYLAAAVVLGLYWAHLRHRGRVLTRALGPDGPVSPPAGPPATPAVPATPATPAVPATPGAPAGPAPGDHAAGGAG